MNKFDKSHFYVYLASKKPKDVYDPTYKDNKTLFIAFAKNNNDTSKQHERHLRVSYVEYLAFKMGAESDIPTNNKSCRNKVGSIWLSLGGVNFNKLGCKRDDSKECEIGKSSKLKELENELNKTKNQKQKTITQTSLEECIEERINEFKNGYHNVMILKRVQRL